MRRRKIVKRLKALERQVQHLAMLAAQPVKPHHFLVKLGPSHPAFAQHEPSIPNGLGKPIQVNTPDFNPFDWDGVVDGDADPQVVLDMLGLVSHDIVNYTTRKQITYDEVASWLPSERKAVAEWAGALHLRASDNDDVVVPPVPEVLRG